jgi:hypothetical protein
MTRTRRPVPRGANPRKRAPQSPPPATGLRKPVVIALITVACAAIVAIALLVFLPNGVELNEKARPHATAACDLISKADKAAHVDAPERYAAAALLLDKAMIESAQAAEADPKAADLDRATTAVHEAAHEADRTQWRNALGTALASCEETLG